MSNLIINNYKIKTLCSVTDDEHEQGLMNVQWPPPVMSFVFAKEDYRKFWMKNTPSPLDIVFCRRGKVLSIHQGVPYSLGMVGPNEKTDLVIEMPQGMASHLNIRKNDLIKLNYDVDTFIKKISCFRNY